MIGPCAMIREEVGKALCVNVESMTAERHCRRQPHKVWALHVSIYLARRLLRFSSTRLGQCFERDHTTILYALEKVEREIAHNPAKAQQVAEIERIIAAKITPEMRCIWRADACWWPDHEIDKAWKLHRAGLNYGQIADRLGRTREQVRYRIYGKAKWLARVREVGA